MNHNIVGWFEIPVNDMDRAINFYEKVFSLKMQKLQFGESLMAFFPGVENSAGASGSLNYHPEFYKPSKDGVLVYFTSPTGNIDEDQKQIIAAGGEVVIPKKLISDEYGYMAVFCDTEGNRLALHSRT